MNVSEANKELGKLKKRIQTTEKELDAATEKREKAQKDSVFKTGVLDEEKAKLQEIKDRLSDLRAMAKDKSIDLDTRERYKALIPEVQQEIADQKTRVSGLQTEWNKIQNSIERYEAKINDASARLTKQIDDAGNLQRQINEAEAEVSKLAVSDQRVVDLNKELLELKERQKELEGFDIGYGYEEYDQNAARIAAITQELKEYKKELSGVASAEKATKSDGGGKSQSPETQSRLNAYLEKRSSIYQKLSNVIGKTSEASAVLQEMAVSSGGKLSGAFRVAGEAAGVLSTKLSGLISAAGPYIAVITAVIAILKKLWSAAVKFASSFTNAIKRGAEAVYSFGSAVAKNFVAALKAIGRFGKSAAKALSGITKKIVATAKQFNVFSRLSESLSNAFKRLGSTIKSALVFSVIYKGLSLVRQQVGAYLSVNTQFTTALRQLQGALLTAFQPIYEIVVPALTTLINILTRAAATVTQFFASLFGTTAKRAQTNAKNLYEQANATEALGEAAEEAAGSLAGFDEINQIQTENKSGGGGASSSDNGPLFDYEYDETPFDSWGEAFSAFLDKLLEGIPKLESAFDKFADWLNDLTKNLYEMFTFPGVLDKVKQLGKDLAQAFEHLADKINWEQLGRALGAGLNLAIAFLNGFIYGGDSSDDSQWKRLGKHLAEAINGLVDEVEWYEFGRLLWGGFKIGLETLAGLLENLNMPALANAASNVIMGFFDEMKKTIDRIQWDTIGNQIATLINEFQWVPALLSMADAIAAAINAVITTLSVLVTELEWEKIGLAIGTAINDLFNKINWQGIAILLENGIKGAFNALRAAIETVDWEGIGETIRTNLENVDWEGIADSIFGAINAAFTASSDFFSGLLGEELKRQLVDMLITISKYTLVIGTLLALSGANIPLGLGLMKVGAASLAAAAVLDWEYVSGQIQNIATEILGILGGAVLVIGALMCFSGANVPLGIGLIAAGAVSLAAAAAINWDFLPNTISGITTKIATILGGALLAIGSILAFSGANIPLGIGLMVAGAASLGTAVAINWESISTALQGTIGKITAIVSGALLALGAVLLFTGAGIPLGLGLIVAGAAGLATTIAANWETIQPKVQGALNAIKGIASAAQLALGVILLFTGAGIPLGLGLIGIGAAGLASVIDPDWNAILRKLKEVFSGIQNWWNTSVKKYFTADYWKGLGKDIVDGFLGGLKSAWEAVTSWVGTAVNWVTSKFSGASRTTTGSFGSGNSGSFGGRMASRAAMPDISNFEIPALARGAVIPPNREFLAVLGDQSSGTNVEAPLKTIEQAVENVMNRMGGFGGDINITVESVLDGKVVARNTVRHINAMTRASGKPVLLN